MCIINVFFGEWPEWMTYFIFSCNTNPDCDFLLFSDHPLSPILNSNIQHIRFSKDRFNVLASKKIGFNVEISHSYKVCDFKPVFGKIFEDYLSDYEFWGYCDIDLIFGNIRKHITDEMLEKFDIINAYRGFLSGPFCLFRNIPAIINLYQNASNYKKALLNIQYVGFDENIQRKSIQGYTFKKILLLVLFLAKNLYLNIIPFWNIKEFRYQFQWYCKKHMLNNIKPIDMTDVVWEAERKGRVRIFFKELILSEYYFKRNRKYFWCLEWSPEGIFDQSSSEEIFCYHFRSSKLKKTFLINQTNNHESFLIKENGIFNK